MSYPVLVGLCATDQEFSELPREGKKHKPVTFLWAHLPQSLRHDHKSQSFFPSVLNSTSSSGEDETEGQAEDSK